MTPSAAACKAAELLGSKAELARRLSVKKPTVSQWCSGIRPIPAARAIEIERLTDNAVDRRELCPSFPWGGAGNSSADHAQTIPLECHSGQTINPAVQASSTGATA
ncbi:helix-turn-helix domain-containing protein [Pseudomonas nitroreducens]|uniref:Helix-turn-helix domain-containing protein n=1 Tax=Pseudomonas nitroreducens TaxID=46680 RepID=A0ABS0KVF6_PSENT|nr:Cro/CI family transcriptional regulator [Pseudomonas nitroreducens]MBG6292075.1 helix-turn-helix domain-containing protein [Pseudomonas nitroreducens]